MNKIEIIKIYTPVEVVTHYLGEGDENNKVTKIETDNHPITDQEFINIYVNEKIFARYVGLPYAIQFRTSSY